MATLACRPLSRLPELAALMEWIAGWPSLLQAGCEAQEIAERTSIKYTALKPNRT